MTRLGLGLLLLLATLAVFALREIASREYDAWAGWVARAMCRLAGRLHRGMRDEWWADVVQAQQERGESGLGFAATVLLSSVRFVVGAAARRVTGRRSAIEPDAAPDPVPDIDTDPDPTPSPVMVGTVVVIDPPFVRTASGRRAASSEFGRRVRERRKQLGLSQERLGERAHLGRTYVGHVERGEVSPSLYNLVQLARALDIDPAFLCRGLKP